MTNPQPSHQRALMPHDITNRIEELEQLIEQAQADADRLDTESTKADLAYELAYAEAFDALESCPMELRKQRAVLATREQKRDRERARLLLRSCKRRNEKLRDQVRLVQSQGALLRSEMNFGAQYGRRP